MANFETLSGRRAGGRIGAAVAAVVLGLAGCEAEAPLTEEMVKEALNGKHRHDVTVDLPISGTLERGPLDKPGQSSYERTKVTFECLQTAGFGTLTISEDEKLENSIRNTYTFAPSDTLLASKAAEQGAADKLVLKACVAEVVEVKSMKELTRGTQSVEAIMGHSEAPAWLSCLDSQGGVPLLSLEARNVCGGAGKPLTVKSTMSRGEAGWELMKGGK